MSEKEGYNIVSGNESCPLNMLLDCFITELKFEGKFSIDTEIGRSLEKFVHFWEFTCMHQGEKVTDEKIKEGLEYARENCELLKIENIKI